MELWSDQIHISKFLIKFFEAKPIMNKVSVLQPSTIPHKIIILKIFLRRNNAV